MTWKIPTHLETVGVWRWEQTDNGPVLVPVAFHLDENGIPVLEEPIARSVV
jgi:hypothetical protein